MTVPKDPSMSRFWRVGLRNAEVFGLVYDHKPDAIDAAKKTALRYPGTPVFVLEAVQGYRVPCIEPVCFIPDVEGQP